ncbi:MAG: alpha-ribazole phosphatase [Flavobacteriaceae bacterium]|nr:alpha-ribazole phosphatase [Flavobacteriaceae bacterium]
MEIYLIRHTTPDIDKGICYGQSDINLVSNYKDEILAVKDKVNTVTFDAVYTSPLSRCVKLAESIHTTYFKDSRLKELNFGDWELRSWDDIPRDESKLWMEDFVNVSTSNGESYLALQHRVIEFYKELISKPYKSVAIVTHAGVIRALLSYVRQIHLKDSFGITVNYGDVITFNS